MALGIKKKKIKSKKILYRNLLLENMWYERNNNPTKTILVIKYLPKLKFKIFN